MIVCVPHNLDPLAYRGKTPYYQRVPDNVPPRGILIDVTEHLNHYLIESCVNWLIGRSFKLKLEQSITSYLSRFFLEFEHESDAILFKLTWGGT